jgi:hypothetical protein
VEEPERVSELVGERRGDTALLFAFQQDLTGNRADIRLAADVLFIAALDHDPARLPRARFRTRFRASPRTGRR